MRQTCSMVSVDALGVVIADPAQRMIVAESDAVIVGCVQTANHGNGTSYLGYLTVDPNLQGAGLGRALVVAAESEARSTFGAASMEMTVIRQRSELIAWYERIGYRQTGERRPFPLDDPRFGLPKTREIEFIVLAKSLIA
jgi:ribosomal protein S18 acetylase RimI-like enzyme